MENTEKRFNIKKVLSIIFNVLFYLFIIFLLIFAIANIRSRSKDENTIPNIFGLGFMNVGSDSMTGNNEDSFNTGDLIFVKFIRDDEEAIKQLKVGDVITFYDYAMTDSVIKLNTHRIVDIQQNGEYFVTQGDKAVAENHIYVPGGDNSALNDNKGFPQHNFYQIFSKEDIRAVYTGKWSGAGKALTFLQSTVGFGLCIVLPTLLLLAFEVFVLVKNVMKLKLEKSTEANKQSLEDEKAKMREELLAELKREQEAKEKVEEKEEDKDSSVDKKE